MNTYYKDLGKLGITTGGDWNIESEYEQLVIVYDTESNASYISKQNVPTGIEITNTDYWQIIVRNDSSESESTTSVNFYEKGGLRDDEPGIRLSTEETGAFNVLSNGHIGRIKLTQNSDVGGLLLGSQTPFDPSDNTLKLNVGTGLIVQESVLLLSTADNSPFKDGFKIRVTTDPKNAGLYIGYGLTIDDNGALSIDTNLN